MGRNLRLLRFMARHRTPFAVLGSALIRPAVYNTDVLKAYYEKHSTDLTDKKIA